MCGIFYHGVIYLFKTDTKKKFKRVPIGEYNTDFIKSKVVLILLRGPKL